MVETIRFQDQKHFKDWIGLNVHSITWEGRYLKDFEEFWELLFPANISITQQFKKIDNIGSRLVRGPLIAWINWLKVKLVCYLFVNKGYSLAEISELSDMALSEVALHIRNFMIERYPHLEDRLNLEFQIGNILSPNRELNYASLVEGYGLEEDTLGSLEDEVLNSLEVTLYSDWRKIYRILKKRDNPEGYFSKIRSFYQEKKIKFLFDLFLLFVVSVVLIFSIKVFNKFYEDYLVEKISIYSPDIFWLEKDVFFKDGSEVVRTDLEGKFSEIEELEKIQSQQVFRDVSSARRYEVESDVVLTSVDTLPKDIAAANLEQSEYEEVKKGGYRNVRYGRRKAYRVMMTSVDTRSLKQDLAKLLKKYGITQADNVKPGTEIPGGMYYNLYVPGGFLKEFLSKVSAFEPHATILESKTVFSGPPNSNKVFIWVKSI